MLLGVLALLFLSAYQKYIVVGRVLYDIKLYILPITYGAIIGSIIGSLLYKKELYNNILQSENRLLNNKNVEIESLYDELEENSQEIDQLNYRLKNKVRKYEYLITSVKELNLYRSFTQEVFLKKIYELTKNLVDKYDFGVTFMYDENDMVKVFIAEGYDQESLNNFNLKREYIEEFYPHTDKYDIHNQGVSSIMSEAEREKFEKINVSSKSILFLKIIHDNKSIGGMFLELKKESESIFTEDDVEIMKAFQTIIENYYEGLAYHKVKEEEMINIVEAMTSMLEFHDKYTKGHSFNVANTAYQIGKYMRLEEKELKELYLGGLLHDIGKTFIPKKLLNKKSQLSIEEFDQIKKHPVNGAEVLEKVESLKSIKESILYHHERWDGEGYPEQLAKNNIPLAAQIINVADAYDAMITDRPYRKALSESEALNQIEKKAGEQFSPVIASVFLEIKQKNSAESKKDYAQ